MLERKAIVYMEHEQSEEKKLKSQKEEDFRGKNDYISKRKQRSSEYTEYI